MRTFSRTSPFYTTNSPSLDKSTKRFTKLKQNLDIYNIRASNYKSALERTFERASQVEDYNYYGSAYQGFSTSSLSFASKPSTSSPSFFSSNPSHSSSRSKRSAVRYNSNSSISPYSKNFSTTPSSTFNKKWDSKIGSNSNYSHQTYDFYNYNYEDYDIDDFHSKSNRSSLKSNCLSNNENNLSNIPEVKKNLKKDNEIILTPNRAQNKKKYIQENEDRFDTTFGVDKNDAFSDAIEKQSEDDRKTQNKTEILYDVNEEEEIEIDLRNQKDELAVLIEEEEEEEVDEKKLSKPENSKEVHSQAYLNAMNAVNSKMKKFNNQLNSSQSSIKKSREPTIAVDINSNSNESDNDKVINDPIQNEEENEFKKKQRVELEEIKSLYALLENELKKIQEESKNATNSNSEIGDNVNANEEVSGSNENLNEENEQHSNSSN